jgi:hypothetical protein
LNIFALRCTKKIVRAICTINGGFMKPFRSIALGALLAGGWIVFFATASFAADEANTVICPSTGYNFVYDLPGALPKEAADHLDDILASHYKETGAQTAVIITENLEAGYESCIDVWGFNRSDAKKKGLLFVFSINDPHFKIGVSGLLLKGLNTKELVAKTGAAALHLASLDEGRDLPLTIEEVTKAAWKVIQATPTTATSPPRHHRQKPPSP